MAAQQNENAGVVLLWRISSYGHGAFEFVGTMREAEALRARAVPLSTAALQKEYVGEVTAEQLRRHKRSGGFSP